jgi:NAD(P)-dependent dehydrogenase (short-subunit alcohol dehydrogenase family)
MTARTAVITGAAGGIGQALVSVFRAAGYRTVAVDMRDVAVAADAVVRMDLDRYCRDESVRRSSNEALLDAIAAPTLDVLVNNAAVQILGEVASLTVDDWQATLNVNLLAPFLLTQALLEHLAAARGSVVNIASVHATLTKPHFVCYATSKAALAGLTRSMAVELGARVRINAVCPAAVSTPMLREGFAAQPQLLDELAALHPVGRIGEPEEIARLVVYLASDAARFINGALIAIDGGIGNRLFDPI